MGGQHACCVTGTAVCIANLAGWTSHCLFAQLVELEEEYLKEHPDAQIQRVQ